MPVRLAAVRALAARALLTLAPLALALLGALPRPAAAQSPTTTPASAIADSAADSTAAREARRTRRAEEAPLFASDTVLRVVLVTDLRALDVERDTLRPVPHRGTVVVAGADGAPVRVPVTVQTRGNFRLRKCDFPPLRVTFDSGAGGTPFARQRSLKLVAHCDATERSEQLVLREYAAYRAHRLVSPLAYRVRLARVRYLDARDAARGDTARAVERYGFFLESDGALAARLGGRELEIRGANFEDAGPDGGRSLALWQYFIGNTDWSLSVLHNVRIIAHPTRGTLAVSYDYDFSGLVNSGYARPSPQLALRDVRERLWRGPCTSAAAMTEALRPFVEHRAELEALYRGGVPGLEERYARDALAYLADFYADVRDPARFARGTVPPSKRCPPTN